MFVSLFVFSIINGENLRYIIQENGCCPLNYNFVDCCRFEHDSELYFGERVRMYYEQVCCGDEDCDIDLKSCTDCQTYDPKCMDALPTETYTISKNNNSIFISPYLPFIKQDTRYTFHKDSSTSLTLEDGSLFKGVLPINYLGNVKITKDTAEKTLDSVANVQESVSACLGWTYFQNSQDKVIRIKLTLSQRRSKFSALQFSYNTNAVFKTDDTYSTLSNIHTLIHDKEKKQITLLLKSGHFSSSGIMLSIPVYNVSFFHITNEKVTNDKFPAQAFAACVR
jgi:hypothetical protein